ncbi:hypothetical protein M422DRAFT_779110 [Sphaerobolus stellatus SS14]|uniref:Exportin-1/Importin-beta-like domain-containing protein n=1 Tax=Sphaerobolus stellatus (strain SS14) TaxID=990650 RepID=A0A0C9W2F1_SPHS4|nr:hypothetical protein M422DRAFT_779110 [Sphaerobolus stellatus SS14]
MTQPSPDVAAVLSALAVFGTATDKAAIQQANSWLQEFQHSVSALTFGLSPSLIDPEAWGTANTLLLSLGASPSARLFAAQTFRAKVTFDLSQVPQEQLIPLRDTILTALRQCAPGPKTVITQLCLALSGLALQLPQWDNPVQDMINTFGGGAGEGVPVLLEFLAVLPEELMENTKIPVSNDDYRDRLQKLLTANSVKVLELMTVYFSSPGVTTAIQGQIFNCVRTWIISGELPATAFAETPLLGYAFHALASDELFDYATNLICDVIHETQELEENMSAILVLVPRIIELRPQLSAHKDDGDRIRGYTRIFAEAGETYRTLLLQAPEQFLPIVEAIAECTAYHDLDIVPITFGFWYRLSQSIGKRAVVPPVLVEAYSALVEIIIQHLHFPTDPASMTAQEADDFRSFRHVMGDTLKDCCHVLGTNKCLMRAYELITTAVTQGGENVPWQAIEAPLFSMRSMGAEIDTSDDQIIPKIMDLMPNLPNHPRVRYAALLVISRYTEWTAQHPNYIPFQLQYISHGFSDTDAEVPAAAGVALKYLCKDCKQHLVSALPQLHSFLNTGAKLNQEDLIQIYEAVAWIISYLPTQEAAQWLKTFATDILGKVHAVVSKPADASKEDIQHVCEWLEHLEVMLRVIQSFGDDLPAACQNTCQEAWALIDALIVRYGQNYSVGEHTMRVCRRGLDFFGVATLPIIPQVLSRLSHAFEASANSSYLWITGKVICKFGNEEEPALRESYKQAYQVASAKVQSLLQQQSAAEIPDILDDTVQTALQLFDFAPDVLFQPSCFNITFTAAIAGLDSPSDGAVLDSLDFIRSVISHDSLLSQGDRVLPPKFPAYAQTIRESLARHALQMLGMIISGLVGAFPEDGVSNVSTIFRVMAGLMPAEVSSWLPAILAQVPSPLPADVKQKFITDVNKGINTKDMDAVKNAVLYLHRMSARIKARRTEKLR